MQDTVGFLNGFIQRLESDIKRMESEVARLVAQRRRIDDSLLKEEVCHLRAMQKTCRNSIGKVLLEIEEFAH
jgi:hypothetical protein